MQWFNMLLEKMPDKLFGHLQIIFPALLHALSDKEDKVVHRDLEVLAQISRHAEYFPKLINELLQRFKEHPQASPPPPAACCTHAHRPRLHLLRHHCPISGAASDCRHARRAMARRPSLHAA